MNRKGIEMPMSTILVLLAALIILTVLTVLYVSWKDTSLNLIDWMFGGFR